MRKARLSYYLVLSLLAVSLVTGGYAQAQKGEIPTEIRIASNPPGGVTYQRAAAVASVIETATGVKVYVEGVGAGKVQIQRVRAGEADMILNNMLSTRMAAMGEGPYKDLGKTPMRLLGASYAARVAIAARKDSGIGSIKDLPGHVWYAYSTGGASAIVLVEGLMKFLGTTRETYGRGWRQYIKHDEYVDAITEGRADAVTIYLGSAFQRIRASVDLKILPIPQDMADFVGKNIPGWDTTIMPAGTFGYPESVRVFRSLGGIEVRANISDEAAYVVTKAIWDNTDKLVKAGLKAEEWNLERALTSPALPFHPGAIRYYKEKGVWTPELEKTQQELVETVK